MKYEIKAFNRSTGQLVIEFDNGNVITIDIPIENSLYIVGEQLDSYIRSFIPTLTNTRTELISKGIANSDYFDQLLSKTEQDYYNERCGDVRSYRDSLLRKCDWVMLPDAGFTEGQLEKFRVYRQQLRDVPQQEGFPDNVVWPETTGEWPNNPDWK